MSDAPRRLHRAAIGAEALAGLRQAALPILVIALLGRGFSVQALGFAAIAIALTVVVAVVQWATTTWTLTADSVRLRRAFIGERTVSIPLERVQAIDTVRGPVQRLFGVVQLDVQAAGGGKRGEIVLRAVTDAEADELREAVRRASGDAAPAPGPLAAAPERVVAPAPPEPAAEWRLGTRPLLVAALTSGSLGVLVPVVAGASQLLDDVLGREDAERLLPDTPHEVALLALAVLVVAGVLSFVGTIVAFAGFVAVREGERLRIRRGVLERRDASVPVARVHAVRVVESPLREPFGLAQLRVETAGYAGEAATAQTLLPLVRRADLPELLHRLVPELAAPLDDLEPVPGRALRRWIVPPVGAALLAAAPAAVLLFPGGLLALLLVPVAARFGLARHRAAGWRLDGERLVVRSRGLVRTTGVARARHLQSVRLSETPFQRRGRLATLAVDVSSGRRLGVRHLDRVTAVRLLGRLGVLARG